jgi:tetratricopeptide (TPR) repeat protein
MILTLVELFPTRDHKHKGTWTVYLPHAQRFCEDREVEDLPERYRLLEKIGLCFIIDGKYDEATKTHATVVQWRENKFGTLEQQTLYAYNNLGEALNLNDDRRAAEMYLEKALKGQKEILKAEHPDTLTSMEELLPTATSETWQRRSETAPLTKPIR